MRCENPCPFEEREFETSPEPALCPNVFGEFNPINPADMGSDFDRTDVDGPNPSNPSEIYDSPCKALNLAFIIDGSGKEFMHLLITLLKDSVTGRPNGGEWKTVRDWVSAVIDELDLESRPGISNVAVMQVLIIVFTLVKYDSRSMPQITKSFNKNGGRWDVILKSDLQLSCEKNLLVGDSSTRQRIHTR